MRSTDRTEAATSLADRRAGGPDRGSRAVRGPAPTAQPDRVARRILTARAGQILAPGSLEATAVRVSWFGPTEIDGVVLRDERGARLIAADRGRLRLEPLADPVPSAGDRDPRSCPAPRSTIERRADGRIDLYETLKPIIREDPEHPAHHRDRRAAGCGSATRRWPSRSWPTEADIRLDIPRDPRPGRMGRGARARRGRRPGAGPDRSFKGSVHRPGDGGATVSLEASRWPWAVELAGGVARGELDAAARRRSGKTPAGRSPATRRPANLVSAGADREEGSRPGTARPDPGRLGGRGPGTEPGRLAGSSWRSRMPGSREGAPSKWPTGSPGSI